MKKYIGLIISSVLLILLFVLATIGYDNLSKNYIPEGINIAGNDANVNNENNVDDSDEEDSSNTIIDNDIADASSGENALIDVESIGKSDSGEHEENQDNINISDTNDSNEGENIENETENNNIDVEEVINQTTDFTVINSEGEAVKLSDFFGKPIIVNFWATWCGPCKMELPAFENAYKKYGEDIEFLMVNLTDGYNDTVDVVKSYVSDNKHTFPVYFDTEYDASNAYNVYSIPETLFINQKGELEYYYIGAMSETLLNYYIENLLK